MKISASIHTVIPKLDRSKDSNGEQPAPQQAKLDLTRPIIDLLEISPEGRRLAADAVIVHEAHKFDRLPQKPEGAPDDYIRTEDLMKRFAPETYTQFQAAMKHDVAEGLSILLKFAKQVPSHPDWIETYRRLAKQGQKDLGV